MPAYRSSAEAEVRDAVVARLREIRPEARIIHEIQCAVYGPNRIDLIAVSKAEIIAVEIKSSKDKLDRLPKQINSMRRIANHVIAAIHEKFLVETKTNQLVAHYERDGNFYMGSLPVECHGAMAWVFPERRRAKSMDINDRYDYLQKWTTPRFSIETALPSGSIDMLWATELRELCNTLHIPVNQRTTRDECMRSLRWLSTGKEITEGVCSALLRRKCTEADPELIDILPRLNPADS